jgi:biopolymer transport protein ExbB
VTAFAPIDRNIARRIAIVAVPLGLLIGSWHGPALAQELPEEDVADTQLAANRSSGSPAQSTRVERIAERPDATPFATPRSVPARFASWWASSDLVGRAAFSCLAAMLAAAGYVVARRAWDQHVLLASARTVHRSFWTAPNLYEAVRNLEPNSPFRAIAEEGLEAATHREGRLTDRISSDEWIVMSLRRSVRAIETRLDAGVAFLSAVTATAPFIGLLGTVWGIHLALTDDGTLLAAAVGAALMTTVAGLAVAVLATLATRWVTKRNTRATAAVYEFAADVQALLLAAESALFGNARPASGRALPPGWSRS